MISLYKEKFNACERIIEGMLSRGLSFKKMETLFNCLTHLIVVLIQVKYLLSLLHEIMRRTWNSRDITTTNLYKANLGLHLLFLPKFHYGMSMKFLT